MQYLNYDKSTGIFTRKKVFSCSNSKEKEVAGTVDRYRYVYIRVLGKRYSAHRLAWLYVYGQWTNKILDHINGNKSDNRILNLRCATKQTNSFNRAKRKDKKTPKGVRQRTRKNGDLYFDARIMVDGKSRFIGTFDDVNDASNAYKQFAKSIHKEFYCER